MNKMKELEYRLKALELRLDRESTAVSFDVLELCAVVKSLQNIVLHLAKKVAKSENDVVVYYSKN